MSRRQPPERSERELLRDLFRRVHADDRPPAFGALLPRPDRSRAPSAPRWRPLAAAAAVALVALGVAWQATRWSGPEPAALSEEQQLALAAELSDWRGPLDFLLDTPSREILVSAPSLELGATMIPPPRAEKEEERP